MRSPYLVEAAKRWVVRRKRAENERMTGWHGEERTTMTSLLKNFWWIAVGAGIVLVLGVGTTVSYLKGGRKAVVDLVKDLTPIELDIKRLEAEIEALAPQIRAGRQVVAEMDVSLKQQREELEELRQTQEKARQEMQALRELLNKEQDKYTIAGREYSRAEVEADLNRRLDRYEETEATIKTREALLAQQKESFATAQRKLRELASKKDQLVTRAEGLKQRLAAVRMSQRTSQVEVDQSALARAEELAKQIDRRLEVLGKTIQMEETEREGIPVDLETTRPAAERFDELFGESRQ